MSDLAVDPRELRLLSIFVAIARAGSIRGAARQLSLSSPVVSTALSDLEERLGETLLRRNTRSMHLTERGSRVLDEADRMLQAANAAMRRPDEAPRGRLGISAPTELSVSWLPQFLGRYGMLYPDVRSVVHADDTIVRLSGSRHDIALRTLFQRSARRRSDLIAVLPLELVCAPSLVEAKGSSLVERLGRIGVIASTGDDGNVDLLVSSKAGGSWKEVRAPARFVVSSRHAAKDLALQGFGAALLIGSTVQAELSTGALVRVSQTHGFGYVGIRLEMRDRYPSAAATAFQDLLREATSEAA